MVRVAIIGLLLIVLAGCRSSETAEERSPGEVAFQANCRTCHRLPKPQSQTDDEWPDLVARYGARARLSDEQIQSISEYLLSAN